MSIKIKSNVSKLLEFGIEIDGSASKPTLRFVIETDNAHYMFPGTLKDNIASIHIPQLNTILESVKAGEYRARVEVIIEDNYYEPWAGIIDIENPREVKILSDFELKEADSDKTKVKINLLSETSIDNKKKTAETAKNKKTKVTIKEVKTAKDLMDDLL